MLSALSVDLRERVIEAIEAGSSRRQAAERFGVGKASAIRRHARFRDACEIAPKPAGGDRFPPAIEAQPRRSWRSAASIRRSSFGSCATGSTSRVSEPARVGCGDSSVATASPVKGLFTQTSNSART